MFILQCILGSYGQSIDFENVFDQADIPNEDPVSIELPRYFKSDGVKLDVVLSLKKSLYGQDKASCLWYEKLKNGLLDSGFVVIKVYTCMFISKTVMCLVYAYNCILLSC